MEKNENHLTDENDNIYENYAKNEQTEFCLEEGKQTDNNLKNDIENYSSNHKLIKTFDKTQFLKKPLPLPKPSIISLSNKKDMVQNLNETVSEENISETIEIVNPIVNQSNQNNSNVPSSNNKTITPDMDFLTYSIPIKMKRQTVQNDETILKSDSFNIKPEAPKLPKLVERNHNRSSSLNEKTIYSFYGELEDSSSTKESSNNYYNLSKDMHNVIQCRRFHNIYESIDESMLKIPPLTTSLSLDMQLTDQIKKKFLFKSKTGKITDNKNHKISFHKNMYEEIEIIKYSRSIIIDKFIKTDFDYINLLAKILSFQKKLVIHNKLEVQFQELYKIVLQIKDCHDNLLEKFKLKLPILHSDQTAIGYDLKEFALYDYQYNKDYIKCISTILQQLKDCDTELEILRYFSISKNNFIELLESLSRPLIQLQSTVSFFEELSKSSPQNAADKHEIKQVLAIGKDFVTEIPDMNFFTSIPLRCSYIIECVKNEKKASYLILFSDVIACQRLYTNKKSKFAWIVPIANLAIHNPEKTDVTNNLRNKYLTELQFLVAKLNLEEEQNGKVIANKKSEMQQRKLEKLDTQILTQLSVLPLTLVDTFINTNHQILFSSEYDRIMWFQEINNCKQARSNIVGQDYNDQRLFNHIPSKSVKTILSESTDYIAGNLCINIISMNRAYCPQESLNGSSDYEELDFFKDLYVNIEIDYYGYYFKLSNTKKSSNYNWDESFNFDIEGATCLLLIVCKGDCDEPFGQALIELQNFSSILKDSMDIKLTNGHTLKISVKFTPKKFMTRRIEPIIPGSIFGVQLNKILDINENGVPTFVVLCVTEIEARGLKELGLYRISGLTKKIQKIRTLFDTNQYAQGSALIKSEDIHGIASLLKLFFHTLPESLFSDKLYESFVYGFTNVDTKKRPAYLLEEFSKLPMENQATANYIIDHLIKVDEHNQVNLMPLPNLATIWGPTLLRPALGVNFNEPDIDKLASEATDMSMQTNILLFFLNNAKSKKN